MKLFHAYLALVMLSLAACSGDDPPPEDDGDNQQNVQTDDVATADVGEDAAPTDASSQTDIGEDPEGSFCEVTTCEGETPSCSPLLEACVECLSDNDCTTDPERTCEVFGVDGGDPTYECVECVRDDQCAGGTCDLSTHICVA